MPNNHLYTTQERTDMVEEFIQEGKNERRSTEVYKRRCPVPYATTM